MDNAKPDIRAIFWDVLEQETSLETSEYLDSICGNDSDLRAKIEALLESHREAGNFLEGQLPNGITTDSNLHEKPGTRIGRFTLLERIGEGGFGDVYLAEQQEPVRRQVALKIIKLGMDTRAVIARFQAERQTLALMDHPNIARVLDAGATDSGRPYFVMDLVRGVPITEYCDANHLTTEQRLRLFIDVCRAIQHSHQKGIIHRDLKPTNILVTQDNLKPVPKIIDFGVAKATQYGTNRKTLFTEHRQLVGTPEYMSPEQATFGETDVDTRSDIYSLGVLLYELIVGTTPFSAQDLGSRGYDEICRVFRESEPTTPSRVVSRLDDAAKVCQYRQTEPAALRKIVQGDLDWIVMKCLEKNRTQRYASALDVAQELERFLAGKPIQARPITPLARASRWCRRNPAVAGLSATLGGLLLLMAVGGPLAALKQLSLTKAERDARMQLRRHLYTARINEAHRAWQDGDLDNTLGPLTKYLPNEGDEDLRGFEWYYLWRKCERGVSATTIRQDSSVVSLAISPNEQLLATLHLDGDLRVSDAQSGELRQQLLSEHQKTEWLRRPEKGQRGGIVRFSPDGKLLVAALVNKLKIWHVSAASECSSLASIDADRISALTISHDSQSVVIGSDEGFVQILDATSDSFQVERQHQIGQVQLLDFLPNGQGLISASRSNVRIWDFNTWKPLGNFDSNGRLRSCAISSDGNKLAMGYYDGTLELRDFKTGETRQTLKAHDFEVHCIAFSRDSRIVATGGTDRTLKLWDAATGQCEETLIGHSRAITGVVFSADGRTLVSAARDGKVKRWALSGNRMPTVFRHMGASIRKIAFSPDGQLLASADYKRTIRVWDLATGVLRRRLELGEVHPRTEAPLASWLDAETIITAKHDRTLATWNITTGDVRVIAMLPHWDPIYSSPDGQQIVGVTEDHAVTVYDLGTRQQRVLAEEQVGLRSANFSPRGDRLAIGFDDGTVKLYAIDSGVLRIVYQTHTGAVRCLAFSPDGRMLASGGVDGQIGLYDTRDQQIHDALVGHADVVRGLAFSPNGAILTSASIDATVKLWDWASREVRITLRGHADSVRCVAFAPDGKILATADSDRTIRLWRAASEREVEVTLPIVHEQYPYLFKEDYAEP